MANNKFKLLSISFKSLIFTLIHVLILLSCIIVLNPVISSVSAFFSFLIKFVAAYLIISDTKELYKHYSNLTSAKKS